MQVVLAEPLRRLACPAHGVVVEAVPFARPGAHLTRDFDDLLAWLATRMDKTAISRLCRVSWRTVGRACERVVATELDPGRLEGLFRIGVDEISWRKHHKYLTLVVDHDRGVVVWGAQGKDSATLDEFFTELGPQRSQQIEAVSLDLGPAFIKSVTTEGHAPNAIICADPVHIIKIVGDALDEIGRYDEQAPCLAEAGAIGESFGGLTNDRARNLFAQRAELALRRGDRNATVDLLEQLLARIGPEGGGYYLAAVLFSRCSANAGAGTEQDHAATRAIECLAAALTKREVTPDAARHENFAPLRGRAAYEALLR